MSSLCGSISANGRTDRRICRMPGSFGGSHVCCLLREGMPCRTLQSLTLLFWFFQRSITITIAITTALDGSGCVVYLSPWSMYVIGTVSNGIFLFHSFNVMLKQNDLEIENAWESSFWWIVLQ
jgi:hypothetical protein